VSRHIGKRAIPIVAKEAVRCPVEQRRKTVHPISLFPESTVRVIVQPIVEVVDDVEVQIAVSIEIEEAGAGAPFRGPTGNAGRGRHIRERAVSVVAVQDVGTESRHIEVEITVVVIVSDGNAGFVGALPGAIAGHSGLLGHVLERAVPVVMVEGVRGAWGPIDEIQIRKTVIVVVNPGDARTKRLHHVFLRRGPRLVHEVDFGFGGHIHELRGMIRPCFARLA
jgi:hypothetical protein